MKKILLAIGIILVTYSSFVGGLGSLFKKYRFNYRNVTERVQGDKFACTDMLTRGDQTFTWGGPGFPIAAGDFKYDGCHYEYHYRPLLGVANLLILSSAAVAIYALTKHIKR